MTEYGKPLIALAATFFGTYGPMVRISGDIPVLIVALTSTIVATLASTTVAVNKRSCVTEVDVADACLIALLYATTKFFLTWAFGMIPVTLAQPVFFIWIPLTILFESIYTTWFEPEIDFAVTDKHKISSVLLLLGIVVLIYADLPNENNVQKYLGGILCCILAATATATRIVLLKYRMSSASPHLQISLQSWAIGIAGCVFLIMRTYGGGATLMGDNWLLWASYSVGIYIAYIALYTGLRDKTASTTAATVSIELLVGAVLGLVMLREFKDTSQSSILGHRIPLHKILGLVLVGSSFVIS